MLRTYDSFPRYLAAKKSIDDRALNRQVWQTLCEGLPDGPLRILELGSGIGTMVERLVEWGALAGGSVYTAVDTDAANMETARERLQPLTSRLRLELETCDVFEFAAREAGRRTWDLLIAHAFLDLVDVPSVLPQLFALAPGGLFYFTLNFDGATILQPAIDPALDVHIETLYHRTMNERRVNGSAAGHSQTGRRLFGHLQAVGADILAAGSSDWVVFAGRDGYPADEAYFLHFIIETMRGALAGHPELDAHYFAAWIAQRHAQIEAGTLVYIAHQLDFVGRIAA